MYIEWRAKKNSITFLTNQKWNRTDQSWLARSRFLALHVSDMYLLQVLIASLAMGCVPFVIAQSNCFGFPKTPDNFSTNQSLNQNQR